MKILVISSMYPKPYKGFSGHFFHRQVLELSKLGFNIRVICPIARFNGHANFITNIVNMVKVTSILKLDNIYVTYLPYFNFPLWISPRIDTFLQYITLLRYLRKNQKSIDFDLIHSYHLFPTGYVALLLSHRMGKPNTCTAVGSDVNTHPYRNKMIAKLTRKLITQSDQIIAVNHELARQIERLAQPQEPVKVIYNGVDTELFKPLKDQSFLRKKCGLPQNGIGFCTVSNLLEAKGLREVVSAFEAVHTQFPSAWLAIIGDGPLKGELEDWVKKHHFNDRVFIVGSRPHNEIASWMCAADIFVLASYAEGLPNVLIEAMACGRPVVATKVGGIPEAAIDGATSILVPSRQVPPLVAAMNRLVENSALRDKMGKAGQQRVKKYFKWSDSTIQLAKIFDQVVQRTKSE